MSTALLSLEREKTYYLNDINLRDRPVQEIHAPVDIKKFISHPRKSNERMTITTLSGLNPTKNVESFINLCSRLSKKTMKSVTKLQVQFLIIKKLCH